MRCPSCAGLEDRVIDSRAADDGFAIRRRRACLGCGHRYTTFERLDVQPVLVVKRSGALVPFDLDRVRAGIEAAVADRPVDADQIRSMAESVEEEVRALGPRVSSDRIGMAVLERLRAADEVAYLRFASVYKDFTDATDFERELAVLTKETEPKSP